jgi:hypothetical protein
MDNNARVVDDSELFFVGDVRGNENPGHCILSELIIIIL